LVAAMMVKHQTETSASANVPAIASILDFCGHGSAVSAVRLRPRLARWFVVLDHT
jgi:hypothetical protein